MKRTDQTALHVEAFDPKVHPTTHQAETSIRAFGIEFKSRYGVLSEIRAMILAVETWLPRGLFWHIEKIDFDSKGGSMLVTLKDREGSMVPIARGIATTLKEYMGDRTSGVFVEDQRGDIIGDAR